MSGIFIFHPINVDRFSTKREKAIPEVESVHVIRISHEWKYYKAVSKLVNGTYTDVKYTGRRLSVYIALMKGFMIKQV